jgi:hypothetical protein
MYITTQARDITQEKALYKITLTCQPHPTCHYRREVDYIKINKAIKSPLQTTTDPKCRVHL